MALQANRYEVKNGNDPTPGNITEEKECELEEFIDYAKVIMGTLGHKLFEPITKPVEVKTEVEEKQADDIEKLYLKRTIKTIGTVEAVGMQTAEGFVVWREATSLHRTMIRFRKLSKKKERRLLLMLMGN